jgi:hypothetical protein
MTFQIRKLVDEDFNELYQLLKQAQFPYLPEDEQLAFKELKKDDNHLYGAFKDDILAVFLCFTERGGKLFFDIACKDSFKKRWANKQILQFIFTTPFNLLGYDEFYTESLNNTAQNAVSKVGFKHVSGNFYKMHKDASSIKKYLN